MTIDASIATFDVSETTFDAVDRHFRRVGNDFRRVDRHFRRVGNDLRRVDCDFRRVDRDFRRVDRRFRRVASSLPTRRSSPPALPTPSPRPPSRRHCAFIASLGRSREQGCPCRSRTRAPHPASPRIGGRRTLGQIERTERTALCPSREFCEETRTPRFLLPPIRGEAGWGASLRALDRSRMPA